MCIIFRKISNFISYQLQQTESSWNWEMIGCRLQKKETVEIRDDCFGGDPAYLQSTFLRIFKRWSFLLMEGVLSQESGPDHRELDGVQPQYHWDQVLLCRPPPVSPARGSVVGATGSRTNWCLGLFHLPSFNIIHKRECTFILKICSHSNTLNQKRRMQPAQ